MEREVLRSSAVRLCTCVRPQLTLSPVPCGCELLCSAWVLCTTANPLLSHFMCCTDHFSLNTAFQGRVLKCLLEKTHWSCLQTHRNCRNSNTEIWEQLWCSDAPRWIGNRDVLNYFCLSDSSCPNYSGCFLKITFESHWNRFSINSAFFFLFFSEAKSVPSNVKVKNPHPYVW